MTQPLDVSDSQNHCCVARERTLSPEEKPAVLIGKRFLGGGISVTLHAGWIGLAEELVPFIVSE